MQSLQRLYSCSRIRPYIVLNCRNLLKIGLKTSDPLNNLLYQETAITSLQKLESIKNILGRLCMKRNQIAPKCRSPKEKHIIEDFTIEVVSFILKFSVYNF